MTSHQHSDLPGARAATARDAALRRMSRINRLAVGGSLVLVAGFTALAATASQGQSRVAATSSSPPAAATSSGTSAGTTAGSGSASTASPGAGTPGWQASSAQTAAPAPPAATQQAPVVVSGGS